MSTETLGSDRTTTGRSALPSPLAQARAVLARGLVAASFWLAVALPFVYLPLVFAGLETTGDVTLVGGLLLANAVALVAGHTHRRD